MSTHGAQSSPTRPFDVITFDCYGTLIDWEAGITEAFRDAAAADGVNLDPAAALRALFEKEPEAQAAEYRSYRELLTDTAVRVGERLGWTISRERAAFLPESLLLWKPFPDTNEALTRLSQAGYALGILSNVDDDLLAGTRQHLAVSLSLLVAARSSALTSRLRVTSPRRGSGLAAGAGSTPRRATSTT